MRTRCLFALLSLAACGGDDDGGDRGGTADAMAEADAEPPPSSCDTGERQTRDRADQVAGYPSVLDIDNDDYYDHGQAWPDLARSAFLDPEPDGAELPPAW